MENRFKKLTKEETQFLNGQLEKVLYVHPNNDIALKISTELKEHLNSFYKGTLREYISHNKGTFVFEIGKNKIEISSIEEFCSYLKEELLDMYKVLNDELEIKTYPEFVQRAFHNLTLELKNEEILYEESR